MHIIFGEDKLKDISDKYTVLELDTVQIEGRNTPITAYCLIESIPITEMIDVEQYKTLHENLIKNYQQQNWKYCEDAVEHLSGKWNGEIDSFYAELSERVKKFKKNGVPTGWNGIIDKRDLSNNGENN